MSEPIYDGRLSRILRGDRFIFYARENKSAPGRRAGEHLLNSMAQSLPPSSSSSCAAALHLNSEKKSLVADVGKALSAVATPVFN